MTKYVFKKSGYFMGRHFAKDAEVELNDKQAKYALLSGQIEHKYPPPPKAMKVSPHAFAPKGMTPPPAPKKLLDAQGEFSAGRSVGGSLGGRTRK